MSFEIKISSKAEADIQQAVDWWSVHRNRIEAERWYLGIISPIESLANMPDRCRVVKNSNAFGREVRQLLYGVSSKITHRIYFGIERDSVIVFRVLSTHQQLPTKPSDLQK